VSALAPDDYKTFRSFSMNLYDRIIFYFSKSVHQYEIRC